MIKYILVSIILISCIKIEDISESVSCCNGYNWNLKLSNNGESILPETACQAGQGCVPRQAYPPYIYSTADSTYIDVKSSHGFTCVSPKWDSEIKWECRRTQLVGSVPGGTKYEDGLLHLDNGEWRRLFGNVVGTPPNYTKLIYYSKSTSPGNNFNVQNSGNPVIDITDIPTAPNGENYTWVDLQDVKKLDGGGLIAYCVLFAPSITSSYVCTFICPSGNWIDWTFDKWLVSSAHFGANNFHPCGTTILQGMSVTWWEPQKRYIAILTIGCNSSPNGNYNDPSQIQRALYWGFTETANTEGTGNYKDFKWVKEPFLWPYSNQTSTRVYQASWEFNEKENSNWWQTDIRKGHVRVVYAGTNESQTPTNPDENKGISFMLNIPKIQGFPCCDLIESDPTLWIQSDYQILN